MNSHVTNSTYKQTIYSPSPFTSSLVSCPIDLGLLCLAGHVQKFSFHTAPVHNAVELCKSLIKCWSPQRGLGHKGEVQSGELAQTTSYKQLIWFAIVVTCRSTNQTQTSGQSVWWLCRHLYIYNDRLCVKKWNKCLRVHYKGNQLTFTLVNYLKFMRYLILACIKVVPYIAHPKVYFIVTFCRTLKLIALLSKNTQVLV